jgi:hypothetical protein
MLSGGFAKEAKRSSLLQTLIAPLAAVHSRLLVLNVLQVFVCIFVYFVFVCACVCTCVRARATLSLYVCVRALWVCEDLLPLCVWPRPCASLRRAGSTGASGAPSTAINV